MQGKQAGQVEVLGERRGRLGQLWSNLKNSVFDVLFVVMDKTSGENEDITIVNLLYESGVDYLQMIQFPFDTIILMVWNGGTTLNNIFNFATNIFAVNNLLPGINYNAFLAILYLIIFMIILVILDIIYVSYSFNRKKFRFTLPLVLLAHIVPLFVTLLFIPVTEFLLSVISCGPSDDDPAVQVMSFFPNVVCFQGEHLIHASITLFFTSIFVFISTVVAMTLFEPRMTANTIAARKSSDGEVIFIVNKIICQFFFSFTPFAETWIYIALMFFPALWLFYFYHFHQPYYNREVGKLYRIFSAYYFWTVLMLTISQVAALLSFNFEGSMVIWFCGLPFIGMNIGYESKSNIDNLFSSNLKFKSGEEVEEHLMYVLKLIHDRREDENANMLLVGYIEKHIETCVEDDCPIKVKKPKKEELLSEMDENCKLLIIQIERMYRQGIKKFPACTRLHISFAFFYMERLQLNAKAYEQFLLAEKASPSFVQQFIIYRFKKIIKEKLEDNNDHENDLIEVIRFDNHVALAEDAMVHSAKLHKEFWSQLSEEMPNLQKLNETGGKIIAVVNQVKLNYNEVRKINSHAPEIIHNYGVYSMFIAQKIHEGKRSLAQAKRAYYQQRSGGLLNEDGQLEVGQGNSSMVVSAGAGAMGKILVVDDNFVEMSGYLKEEITEKSIEKILPQVMMFYHEFAMNRWLNDPQKLYMQGEGNCYFREAHRGFLKQKNGFIIPVLYKVAYSIFEEKFHVHFRHEKEFTDNLDLRIYIVTDHRGLVRDISALGFSYFSLNKDNLSSGQRYIDDFGIAFDSDLYHDGSVATIRKQPLRNQDNLEPRENSNSSGNPRENSNNSGNEPEVKQDGQQFFVKAEKILMPFQGEQEEELEINQHNLIVNGRRNVGSIFYLERVPEQRVNNRDVKLESLDRFGLDIMDMYEPNEEHCEDEERSPLLTSSKRGSVLSQLVGHIKGEDLELKERTFHNYAERIKTYRIEKGELKRIVRNYEMESDGEVSDEEKENMSVLEMEKLKNPLYVEKILAAINTNIDHREVSVLKVAFSLFFVALITLSILSHLDAGRQFSTIEAHMAQNHEWVKDQFYISNLFHLSYNLSQENNQTAARLRNKEYALSYQIAFDPDLMSSLEEISGQVRQVRLNQALTWVQGYLINFFQNTGIGVQETLLLNNYYLYVYPAIQSFSSPFKASYLSLMLYVGAIFTVASIVVAVWIYSAICIDVKCFDVILWFLDIPVAYVGHLLANCNTYIKSRVPVKELIEKGINFHDRHLYLQDYQADPDATDDMFNEESKSRKTMIARFKRKTLLSRCDCGYVQLIWLLLYSLLFSVALFVYLHREIAFYQFLNKEWNVTARQFLWSSTIPNGLRLIMQKNVTQMSTLNFTSFQQQLQNKFLNTADHHNLGGLLGYSSDVSSYYQTIFEGDICSFAMYSPLQKATCKSQLQGKLQGGINSVFAYYPTLDQTRYLQIQKVQYEFVNVQLLKLFGTWEKAFRESVGGTVNLLTLLLALYMIVSLMGFVLLWWLYLNKLNVRLNQTIQMLNMIPMKMLPKGRRDIRDFFNWIIREANKNKTEQ